MIFSIGEIDKIKWEVMTPLERMKLISYKKLGEELAESKHLSKSDFLRFKMLIDWVVENELSISIVQDSI